MSGSLGHRVERAEDAVVELAEGGRVLVKTGAADMGQGSDTIAAQIAAEVLGCPYELVDVLSCDTALCPDGGMTTASRQSYVTGNAVKGAAEALRALIAACLAGRVPDAAVLDSVRKELLAAGTPPSAEFTYKPPRTWPHQTNADPDPARKPEEYAIHYSYCYASAAVAVEVNEETGEVKVLKVTAAQDVGKALHPGNVRGQIEGAVAMGIGLALSEEFLEDDRAVITDSLKKLGVPMIRDLPPIQAIIVEQAETDGPFGAKGLGEHVLIPTAPAILNAVRHATGVTVTRVPLLPHRLRAAILAKGAP